MAWRANSPMRAYPLGWQTPEAGFRACWPGPGESATALTNPSIISAHRDTYARDECRFVPRAHDNTDRAR